MSCRAAGDKWVTPTCLNLDAVANCTSNVKDSQIFYSSTKFTIDQAKADCATRNGFTFASGNQRTVLGAKKP